MSNPKEATIEIDPNGGPVTVEMVATHASVGNYKIFNMNKDPNDPIASGEMTETTPFNFDTPSELIDVVIYVIVNSIPVNKGKRLVGASVRFLQGDAEIAGSKLDDKKNSEGMVRFDFEYTIKAPVSASKKASKEAIEPTNTEEVSK